MGAAWRRTLVKSWQRRGALAWILWPVSILYRSLAALRHRLYAAGVWRVEHVGVPVVVVGNVVAGGAGKTPVVMALVRHLQARGISVGVISRGYGRTSVACREVHGHSTAKDVGDEPLLIKSTTAVPVFVARRRVEAARRLLEVYPQVQVLVCDDGLQHYSLHRDVEVCVFDEQGAGNGFLLPAGPLREPWPRPGGLVLSSGARMGPGCFTLERSLASHARRSDGSTMPLDEVRALGTHADTPLWAVAGIAHPEAFFSMLRRNGLPLAHTQALPDHANFDTAMGATYGKHMLLCTEKDAVKLWRQRPDALAVPLRVQIESAFWDAFDELLSDHTGEKPTRLHGHTSS